MVRMTAVTKSNVTISANAHLNVDVPYSDISGIVGIALQATPNSAYVVGSIVSWNSTSVIVGLYNTHSGSITGSVTILIFYS